MTNASTSSPSCGSSLDVIEFHGDQLLVALDENSRPQIVLKPAIEAIGLDYKRQYDKLKSFHWATMGITPTVGSDGRVRDMVTVDLRTFLMLLATINVSRVAEHVRPKLIDYQREVADVIEAHFTGGRHHVNEPNTVTWEELVALIAQRYGLVFEVVDLRRALRDGGVLKQNGAPRKNYRAWFWFTGSAWTVHPHVTPQLLRKAVDTRKALGDVQAQLMEVALDSDINRDIRRIGGVS